MTFHYRLVLGQPLREQHAAQAHRAGWSALGEGLSVHHLRR